MGHSVLDTLPFPRGQVAGDQKLASPSGDGTRISQVSTQTDASGHGPLYDNGTGAGTQGNSDSRFRPDLAGKIYNVRDTKNGTGQNMKLRAVQLTAAITVGAATAVTGPGTCLQFDTTYGRDGVVIGKGGAGNTAPVTAVAGKPLDDSYPVGLVLPAGTWVYVVEEGPCKVPIVSGQARTEGKEAACHSDGSFRDATTNDVVVGRWLSVAAASGTTTGVLYVEPGLKKSTTAT